MPITFRCPHCQQELSAPDEAAGQAGKCRFCGATVQAPTVPDESAHLIRPGEVNPPALPPIDPYSGNGPSAGRLSAMNVVAEAWQVVTSHSGVFIGAMLIIAAVAIFLSILLMPQDFQDPSAVGESLRSILVRNAVMLTVAPLEFGLYYLAYDLFAHGHGAIGRMFSGYRSLAAFLGIAVLHMIPSAFTEVAFQNAFTGMFSGTWVALFFVGVVVSVLVNTLLLIAPVAVIDRKAGIADALRLSWQAAMSRFGVVLAITALLMLVAFAGLLACGIGALWTYPVWPVGAVIVYRELYGLRADVTT